MFMTNKGKNILHSLYLNAAFGSGSENIDQIIRTWGQSAWLHLWYLQKRGLIKPFRLVEGSDQVWVRLTEAGMAYVDLMYIQMLSNDKPAKARR